MAIMPMMLNHNGDAPYELDSNSLTPHLSCPTPTPTYVSGINSDFIVNFIVNFTEHFNSSVNDVARYIRPKYVKYAAFH